VWFGQDTSFYGVVRYSHSGGYKGRTKEASPVTRSVEIAIAIARDLIQYCKEKAIPFGFNIESVAIRKEEINASLELLNTVRDLLKVNGLRGEVGKEEIRVGG
jgi:hypothetical protein